MPPRVLHSCWVLQVVRVAQGQTAHFDPGPNSCATAAHSHSFGQDLWKAKSGTSRNSMKFNETSSSSFIIIIIIIIIEKEHWYHILVRTKPSQRMTWQRFTVYRRYMKDLQSDVTHWTWRQCFQFQSNLPNIPLPGLFLRLTIGSRQLGPSERINKLRSIALQQFLKYLTFLMKHISCM